MSADQTPTVSGKALTPTPVIQGATMAHVHLLLRTTPMTPPSGFTTMARALTNKATRIWPMYDVRK